MFPYLTENEYLYGVKNKNTQTFKAMRKDTKIISEISNFFQGKQQSSLLQAYSNLVDRLNVSSRMLGGVKKPNCKLTNLQIFHILLFMPFFDIKGFSHYAGSVLWRMFSGKKDLFYDFMSQDNVDWRQVLYHIARKMIDGITIRTDHKESDLPSVLIVDDTDLPKTGFHIEKIGRVFSHVAQRSILGFKALTICWSDGKTVLGLEQCLLGENGKNEKKPQGLTSKQRKERFAKTRDQNSHGAKRLEEYMVSKCVLIKEMVKRACAHHIPFDYLLVDSWFTNTGLVDYVCHSHKKFHLLGMGKMGNTKYGTQWGELTAKAILERLKTTKCIKYSRALHCKYAIIDVTLGKRKVRLFFCQRAKAEKWKFLVTTNLKLDFMKAYRIYAMRWGIEVFYEDNKRYLGLCDCSCRNFTSQLAHVTLVTIRYNIMAYIKRFYNYETIGGLYRDTYLGVKEITVIDYIWQAIIEVIVIVAEITASDEDVLLNLVITDSRKFAIISQLAHTA